MAKGEGARTGSDLGETDDGGLAVLHRGPETPQTANMGRVVANLGYTKSIALATQLATQTTPKMAVSG